MNRTLIILVVCLPAFRSTHAADVRLHKSTTVHFATKAEGVAVLMMRDRFVKSMSPFDRQARLKTSKPVAEKAYLEFAARHVIDWEPDKVRLVTKTLESINKRLTGLNVPFPKRIVLVHTTGQEESGAAYCRGNAIILPVQRLQAPARRTERLVIHELFHVLSNQNPKLRKELYAVIGFRPCNDVPLPDGYRERKITNPDGPAVDYYIELDERGKKMAAAPILFSKVKKFPGGDASFFQLMQFKLMVIEKRGDRFAAVIENGVPVLLDVDSREMKTPKSFFQQIGRNTRYIIHPDEVLADNFVDLVLETKDLKTPRVIDGMRRLLGRAPK